MAGLLDYSVSEFERVVVEDAKGDPMIGTDGKEIIAEIYSPGSKQYANATAKKSTALVNRMKKKGKFEQSPEAQAREAAEFLADCTKSFTDNLGDGFEDLSGRDLYIAIYSNEKIGFVKDQISQLLSDWANFTPVSMKN